MSEYIEHEIAAIKSQLAALNTHTGEAGRIIDLERQLESTQKSLNEMTKRLDESTRREAAMMARLESMVGATVKSAVTPHVTAIADALTDELVKAEKATNEKTQDEISNVKKMVSKSEQFHLNSIEHSQRSLVRFAKAFSENIQ